MTRISFDTPCYFFTSVAHHRLPIFQTDRLKEIMCSALNDARRSSGMSYFAYVIMEEHFHILTDGKRSPSDSLRFLNGVSARKIIDYLKENGLDTSLAKLKQAKKKDGWQYSVWEHHSDKFLLTSDSKFMEKVNYIHNNPVEEGLVERPEDYLYSSATIWQGKPLEVEPLEMDIGDIDWRR